MPENIPLEHPMVSKAIEQAQVKVEGFHFDARKRLVEYDDVMNKQRELIYKMRRKTLQKPEVLERVHDEVGSLVSLHAPDESGEAEYEAIINDFSTIVPFEKKSQENLKSQISRLASQEEVTQFLIDLVDKVYKEREKQLGSEMMREIEKWVGLGVIDRLWMEHLDATDDLREGIGLRGYAQRDPLVEYKSEAYRMFEKLTNNINFEIARRIFRVQVAKQPTKPVSIQLGRGVMPGAATPTQSPVKPIVSGQKRPGRNDPCPCGSGKKYKKCCYPKYG